MQASKGNVETISEIKQGEGGTKPTEFYNDKTTLIELIKKFNELFQENETVMHPVLVY